MDYFYYLTVNYPGYMQAQIIALGLTSGNITNINVDSSVSPWSVDLTFNATLSIGDKTTLDAYMAAYADPFVTAPSMAAIVTALGIDANVMTIARARILQTVPLLDVITLLQVCTLLAINPHL
jgi:hypothetical protein